MEGKVIHLWVDGEEKWKAFELSTATEELKKRGIQIGEGVYLGDGVCIGTGARIGDRAYIDYRAHIGMRAHIDTEAGIDNMARIGAKAYIESLARIDAGAKTKSIYITGFRYPVAYWGEDRVDIGCHSRSIEGLVIINSCQRGVRR